MFALLLAFTGSVVLPLKALVLNMLSLSATLGAMVFIFQEGHLKGLVGDFTAIGTLAAPVPVLMFCLAFGLSMDYEVFLLSRITRNIASMATPTLRWCTGCNASAPSLRPQHSSCRSCASRWPRPRCQP